MSLTLKLLLGKYFKIQLFHICVNIAYANICTYIHSLLLCIFPIVLNQYTLDALHV